MTRGERRARRQRRRAELHEIALSTWDASLILLSVCLCVSALAGTWWLLQVAMAR